MICLTSGYLNTEASSSSEEILGTLLRKAAKLKIFSVVKRNVYIYWYPWKSHMGFSCIGVGQEQLNSRCSLRGMVLVGMVVMN